MYVLFYLLLFLLFFVRPNIPDVSSFQKDDICRILPELRVNKRRKLHFGLKFDGYDVS